MHNMLNMSISFRQGARCSCGAQPPRMSAMRNVGPRPAVHVAPAAALRRAKMLTVISIPFAKSKMGGSPQAGVPAMGGPPRRPPAPRAAGGDHGGGGNSSSDHLPWIVVTAMIFTMIMGSTCFISSRSIQQGMLKAARVHGTFIEEGMMEAAQIHSQGMTGGAHILKQGMLEHGTLLKEGIFLPLWIGAVSAAAALVLTWYRDGGGGGGSGAGWMQRGGRR